MFNNFICLYYLPRQILRKTPLAKQNGCYEKAKKVKKNGHVSNRLNVDVMQKCFSIRYWPFVKRNIQEIPGCSEEAEMKNILPKGNYKEEA